MKEIDDVPVATEARGVGGMISMMRGLERARNRYIERMIAARRRGDWAEAKYYARHAAQVEMYLAEWRK